MSWLFVGITLGTAAAGSAALSMEAGKIQNIQAKTAAKAEEGAAIAREADRMARLNEALSSQNAAAGAGGVLSFEGSPLTVMQEDISRAEEGTERDTTMSKIRSLTLRSQGRIAQRQAKTGAALGLLQTAGTAALKAKGRGSPGGSSPGGSSSGGGG